MQTRQTVDFASEPHRRYNPLTGEWVLVSPQRNQRPWQGQTEPVSAEALPTYDSGCYLCPGNERAGGHRNPAYESTFVFPNDFPALLPSVPTEGAGGGLFSTEAVTGECRVICFSPRHDLTLAKMEVADIARVVDAWAEQAEELGKRYKWVQVFENRGEAMGASNPHPHGQVWACDYLPTVAERELAFQAAHLQSASRPLLVDVAEQELTSGERVVAANEGWVLVVPFWAVWPFEYLLLPRRPVRQLFELSTKERQDLASILRDGLQRYDRLFATSFPYSMGWHGAPNDGLPHEEWVLHAHFFPPLLRSATVRKFMVGFELLAESQRDLTAEIAAERLRQIVP